MAQDSLYSSQSAKLSLIFIILATTLDDRTWTVDHRLVVSDMYMLTGTLQLLAVGSFAEI